jgi:natural product biosynthesis luciferase-like monooxygenase protein
MPRATDHPPIAILGLACRFPGAPGARAFWRLLRDRKDAIREVPADRWDVDAYYHPEPGTPGKMNTRWGGFLDAIDLFDPQLFGLSPREAESMDPQQRLAIEIAFEALQDAAIAPSSLRGQEGGVFIGAHLSDYYHLLLAEGAELGAHTSSGNAHSILANRISYLFDLKGPSLAVDTACSSSLVALHMACRSLRDGESNIAIAGGVNLILSPEVTIALSQAGMMSSDGRCKAFDARADGYVRSEGCGLVVLKRLEDALRDGDPVRAVIRGSAVNQDGRSNGLTAPNGPSQEAVISRALADAGVANEEVSYVEAHGTGTPLGDPIEIQALGSVFSERRSSPLRVGSVKTNIGHLESASGIAGVIKVVLQLEECGVAGNLHLERANPKLGLEVLPIAIPATLLPWPRSDRARVAGVSSFGFGGTNAHVIVAEAPEPRRARPGKDRSAHVLALSARTPALLMEEARLLAARLAEEPWLDAGDVAHTRNVGRDPHRHRVALVAQTTEELESGLAEIASGRTPARAFSGEKLAHRAPKIAFLFPGQGAQVHGMGRALFDCEPSFRRRVEACARLADPCLPKPLLSVMYGDAPDPDLNRALYAQISLFVLEHALAEWWRSIGVEPAFVLGNSLGEIAAATVAGAIALEDAIDLVLVRGRLMEECGGAMAAIFAPPNEVERAIEEERGAAVLAAVNADHVVISGGGAAVARAAERLERGGRSVQRLKVSGGFHSPEMDPILDRFERAASRIAFRTPERGWISDRTGDLMMGAPDASHWARQIREPVQLARGLEKLVELGASMFVDLGPSGALARLGLRTIGGEDRSWLPSLAPSSEWSAMGSAAAALWARGVAVDWRCFDRAHLRSRLHLPALAYDRRRLWFIPKARTTPPPASAIPQAPAIELSLLFFAREDRDDDGYALLLDAARFADERGFAAVWTPEHHFHEIGGAYADPAITSAAIASVTSRIAVRGSMMLPLHHPIRVAEAWAMVDRLSGGRAGVAFDSGLYPNDFVLVPSRYEDRRDVLIDHLHLIRRLWSGEAVPMRNGVGDTVPIAIFPRPHRGALPVWLSAGCEDIRYRLAGELGASILAPLAAMTFDDLRRRIELYRETWRSHGHPGNGHVTVMMHAYLGDDIESVRAAVRGPMRRQLELTAKRMAELTRGTGDELAGVDDESIARFAEIAFEAHFERGGLFGTPKSVLAKVESFKTIGVDEIACLVDFGVPADGVRASLVHLDRLRMLSNPLERCPEEVNASHSTVPRPERRVEPGNETERVLAEIFRSVLRLDEVGLDDNFFQLGGDSRLGIEIVSRARRAGFAIDPLHLFEHPTIAELAERIGAGS